VDGAIGNKHVTIPDLIDPVLGFRAFNIREQDSKKIIKQIKEIESKRYNFNTPAAYKMESDGKLVPDYEVIELARSVWNKNQIGVLHELESKLRAAAISPLALTSGYNTTWTREMEAICNASSRSHLVPSPECTCGLYCYYSPEGMFTHGSIGGIVTCWGRIEAHSSGMRVQRMRIEVLITPTHTNVSKVKELAKNWEIPCVQYTTSSHLKTLAADFGSLVPESMRAK
jgi:hypothetical protein